MNLNKVIILGRLTSDPEAKKTKAGKSVVTLGIATNRSYTLDNGEKKEEAEFHSVVLFGGRAEVADKYLSRGDHILVEGRLRTRNWEKDGTTHYRTEIVAYNLELPPRKWGERNEVNEDEIF